MKNEKLQGGSGALKGRPFLGSSRAQRNDGERRPNRVHQEPVVQPPVPLVRKSRRIQIKTGKDYAQFYRNM